MCAGSLSLLLGLLMEIRIIASLMKSSCVFPAMTCLNVCCATSSLGFLIGFLTLMPENPEKQVVYCLHFKVASLFTAGLFFVVVGLTVFFF